MMRPAIFIFTFFCLVLSGCGGNSSSLNNPSSGSSAKAPSIQIAWPARSRILNAPTSAQSAILTLHDSSGTSSDLSLSVVRAQSAAFIGTYIFPSSRHAGTYTISAKFYTDTSSASTLVGTAGADATLDSNGNLNGPNGSPIGAFQFVGAVKNARVASGQVVFVGQSSLLSGIALDANNSPLVVSDGSIRFSITSGTQYLNLSPDGTAVGIADGVASISVTVDGVTSPPMSVTVTTVAPASITVAWPTRSREANAPSSALSVAFTLSSQSGTQADLVVLADRASPQTIHHETYSFGKNVPVGLYHVSGSFFANVGQGGALVGGLSFDVKLNTDGTFTKPDGSALGTIEFSPTIRSVQIEPGQSVAVGSQIQLNATAFDVNLNPVVVSPGSFTFSSLGTSNIFRLTTDGSLTGIAVGTAMVNAAVDGVSATPVNVQVFARVATKGVTVDWPLRSRSIVGPSSALSVQITLHDPLGSQQDAELSADRSSLTTAHSETYNFTSKVRTGRYQLLGTFFAGATESGAIVGNFATVAQVNGDGTITNTDGSALGPVVFTGTIAHVAVLGVQTVLVGQTLQLSAAATDGNNSPLVISPGSFTYSDLSNSGALTVSLGGLVTGVSAGSDTVIATVDGVQATPAVLTVQQSLAKAGAQRGMLIGATASSGYLQQTDFATTLTGQYSELQVENEMKFDATHPRPDTDPNPFDFSVGDLFVNFAQQHHMALRGSPLLWYQQLPGWLTGGNYNAAQVSTILSNYISKTLTHYQGKVYAYDVVNEAFNDDGTLRSSLWYDSPGIGFSGQGTKYIEQAFVWAHAADPSAKLFYNDYSAETENSKSNAIYNMVQDFKNRGVPVDGVGFQFHIDLNFDNPGNLASLKSNFDRFAALGVQIQVTELDIRVTDNSPATLAAQAKLYGEITKICYQQPAVKTLQTWGFTDKYSWIPYFFSGYGYALPFDSNYQPKPAYTAIYNALIGK